MTLRGIFCLALEAFLLIIAFGTNILEFLIIAACLGGLIFFAFLSSALAVFSLSFSSKTDKTDFLRGEEAKYCLTLRGPLLLPCVGCLTFKTAEYAKEIDKKDTRQNFVFTPFWGDKRELWFNMQCPHIGHFEIGTGKLRIKDLFGLFSFPSLRSEQNDFIVSISVLPRTYTLSEKLENVLISQGLGSTAVFNSESGETLGDSRLYQKGDALKRINWKQSARHKKLFTRQYEVPEMPKVLIAVDTSCYNDGTGTIVDISCETAISLAWYFINQNSTVHMVTLREDQNGNDTSAYYKTLYDLNLMQYSLLDIPFRKESLPLEPRHIKREYIGNAEKIFIITPCPSSELFSLLLNLVNQDKTVCCILPLAAKPTAELKTAIKDSGINPVILGSVDEIAGKVGGLL
ncbi:MAG: DUF58 domain-containing protein [Acutalibacteraceae bacterium]|jgi:uncharacterized protein (DUF58 family)